MSVILLFQTAGAAAAVSLAVASSTQAASSATMVERIAAAVTTTTQASPAAAASERLVVAGSVATEATGASTLSVKYVVADAGSTQSTSDAQFSFQTAQPVSVSVGSVCEDGSAAVISGPRLLLSVDIGAEFGQESVSPGPRIVMHAGQSMTTEASSDATLGIATARAVDGGGSSSRRGRSIKDYTATPYNWPAPQYGPKVTPPAEAPSPIDLPEAIRAEMVLSDAVPFTGERYFDITAPLAPFVGAMPESVLATMEMQGLPSLESDEGAMALALLLVAEDF